MPKTFEKKEAKWFQDFELPEVPLSFEQNEILGWSVNRDDVVAFNMATLHVAPGSVGDSRRRVFSLLNTGAEMRAESFPLLT